MLLPFTALHPKHTGKRQWIKQLCWSPLSLGLRAKISGEVGSCSRPILRSETLLGSDTPPCASQVEERTPFAKKYTPGEGPLPSAELAADMYRMAARSLTGAGLEHYEISNYARAGHRRASLELPWMLKHASQYLHV